MGVDAFGFGNWMRIMMVNWGKATRLSLNGKRIAQIVYYGHDRILYTWVLIDGSYEYFHCVQ